MGKFGSDRNSSPGGGAKFNSRPSGFKKHSSGDKRHASNAPTGKFGFARLQNDDGGSGGAGARERVGGGGQSRSSAPTGSIKKHKVKGDGSGQSQQAAATSVRSALKHVAIENLVAGGAKKSKLLQKVYDSDAFAGASPPPFPPTNQSTNSTQFKPIQTEFQSISSVRRSASFTFRLSH
jgi:hypothetical protein